MRTVQRWEKEVGLPVHRINTGGGEGVYAYVAELERWQASAAGQGAATEPCDAGHQAQRAEISNTEHANGNREVPARREPRRLRWIWLVGIVVIAATVVALWLLRAVASTQPAQWRIEGNKLLISNRLGRFLWDYPFEFPLNAAIYSSPWALDEAHPAVVFHDINGDGHMEVLFLHDPWRSTSRGLYCFTHDGVLLFHRDPPHEVHFGEKTFAPPWRAAAVNVFGPAGRPHDIWFLSSHLEEFPTVLEKLDTGGNVQGQYWSNGQVYSVTVGEVVGRPLVFVGGISNEFKGGSLAILDATQPSGSAPAVSDHYRCADCPARGPLAFFVFPRLDVTVAIDEHSKVAGAVVDRSGQILVDVSHYVGQDVAGELQDAAVTHYTLDSQFRVIAAELGTRYWRIHAEFERKDLLKHPFDPMQDARYLWPVRRWSGSAFTLIAGPASRPSR